MAAWVGKSASPNYDNIVARGSPIAVLKCPSDQYNNSFFDSTALGDNWARGNYAGNAGAGSWANGSVSPFGRDNQPIMGADGQPGPLWRGTTPIHGRNSFWPSTVRGIFGPNTKVRIGQLTDGTSKSLMIAEIRTGLHEKDWRGAWAIPHPGGSLVSQHGSGGDSNGPNNCDSAGHADDRASGLTDQICGENPGEGEFDALLLECMTCKDDPGFFQASPRSLHPSGINIALADGIAQFLSDDIETTGAFGACCSPWDHLIMSADGSFTR